MIIYATFSELSVAKLFMAGVVPGLVLTLMFMALHRHALPARPETGAADAAGGEGLDAQGHPSRSAPMVGLMLVILGSIYLGIATPTEAAARRRAASRPIIAWFVRRPPPAAPMSMP